MGLSLQICFLSPENSSTPPPIPPAANGNGAEVWHRDGGGLSKEEHLSAKAFNMAGTEEMKSDRRKRSLECGWGSPRNKVVKVPPQ